MNALELYILQHKWSELEALNLLQDYGVISDNCVWARDVAEADWKSAMDVLLLLMP